MGLRDMRHQPVFRLSFQTVNGRELAAPRRVVTIASPNGVLLSTPLRRT
jgi:hypothetical protein